MRRRISPRCLTVLTALLGLLATISSAQDGTPGVRLLKADEGMILVNAASKQRGKAVRKTDCSHLVHQIYGQAGFPYPYASSYDLYDGIDNFRRVSTPRAGDLVVWRGHVGILTDPVARAFFSSVSSGFRTEYYDGPYWRTLGRPRFYRYVLTRPAELTATNSPAPMANSGARSNAHVVPVHKENGDGQPLDPNLPATRVESDLSLRPMMPSNNHLGLPSSIPVGVAATKPTDKEVGDAIAEFNSASGNQLHGRPMEDSKRTIVVYDKLRIDRIDLNHDRGWVNAEVDGRLSIGDKGFEGKHRIEKLRWELRRTPQGWRLQVPANRSYVPRDVAVRVLAGQLALLAGNEAASDDLNPSLQQQGEIVRALGFLFDPN